MSSKLGALGVTIAAQSQRRRPPRVARLMNWFSRHDEELPAAEMSKDELKILVTKSITVTLSSPVDMLGGS